MLSTIEAPKSKQQAPPPNAAALPEANRVSPSRRAADWLASKIEQGKKSPFSEVVTLTPEIAEVLLANNAGNRVVKQRTLQTFVADISLGRWDLNGETIIVADTGELNDGQHRCLAVVQAGKPIRTVMIFGIPRDSRYTVDMGVVRTSGDFLSMENVSNSNNAATVAKYLNLHRRGFAVWSGGGASQNITKVMIRQEYWDNAKAIQDALKQCERKTLKAFGQSVCATAYCLIAKKNPVECNIFFTRIDDGVGLQRGSAILACRNRMMRYDRKKMFLSPAQKVEMIIRYWNAWRKKVDVHQALAVQSVIPKIEG